MQAGKAKPRERHKTYWKVVASWGPGGKGQALLGAGDQNREPTAEGEKSHRTPDGQRDGLL